MGRLALAVRCFFELLWHGRLSDATAAALGLAAAAPPAPAPPPAAAAPAAAPAQGNGALQLLAILQRDARLVDFLMEDISAYPDEQVGAAVRELHEQCRRSLNRYVRLVPVLDAAENARTTVPAGLSDPGAVKFIGNVPATHAPTGGILRHRGWRAESVELPPVPGSATVIAPAEIEVE